MGSAWPAKYAAAGTLSEELVEEPREVDGVVGLGGVPWSWRDLTLILEVERVE